jgi:Protein of unknown function (DUF2946)
MHLRRWIGWLAVAAILLHTGTVARHNVVMYQKLSAALAAGAAFEAGLICHVESSTDGDEQSLPGDGGSSPSKPCPVCLGLASAHALPTSDAPALSTPQIAVHRVSVPREIERAPASRFSLPLTRGPPNLA